MYQKISFNKPPFVGREIEYIKQVIENRKLSGNGRFTQHCQERLKELTGSKKILLTTSCTAALEMAAILANVGPGDEVIIPSFTFVSTANAFVLRRATPVFVDISEDTLNMDPEKVAKAITNKTRAVVPVHYAGIGCDMKNIIQICQEHNLLVIEDAAQALMSKVDGLSLGSIGDFGALSFHETKNVVSGEGGALLINNPCFSDRAEIIWEKGTNRSKFFRGEVDKYTWVDIGSSYLPSELQAAYLLAQLEEVNNLTDKRKALWFRYKKNLRDLESKGYLKLPQLPSNCINNGHLFYIILNTPEQQERILKGLNEFGIYAVFHYQPLHNSPAGLIFGRTEGDLKVTEYIAARIIRLPMFADLTIENIDHICEIIYELVLKSRLTGA